ncbi:hypothetical protein Dda_1798 [Drechslerella dactyloides]|uniref:RING-type domain-containing protein n=1 Tax=Drechslerella dactyloides TaxID=74499 RepID=A0AAD6J3Q9_DREDA|nr:hypothetical protein Dda_1798 [Drechslerella dactyloides]
MDTCIVCLAELPEKNLPRNGTDGLPISYNLDDLPEFLLARLPCSHVLHNNCLKPWVERANSCPICRKAFNVVELVMSPTGEALSSYCVDDKVQVSDYNDHNMLPSGASDNDRQQVGEYSPACFICNEPGSRGESSTASSRRGRNRPNYDPWERAWLTVGGRFESLEVAYSMSNNDDEPPEPAERDLDAWNRRIDVARRQGGAEVLHEAVPRILERLPFVHQEPVMTDEEKSAWAMLEEAEGTLLNEDGSEIAGHDHFPTEGNSGSGSTRKRRLSKLLTSSPRVERRSVDVISMEYEPTSPTSPTQPAPERKLKRPRTRRLVPTSLMNPESPIESQPGKSTADVALAANSPPAPARDPPPSSPTLLDTLLADIDKPQTSTMVGLKFPRPISSTRPTFLPPSSPLTPPVETPESIPASPFLEGPAEVITLPHSPPAEPSSPPPRQDSASPSGLSLSNKKEIEKLVRLALAPYYQAGDMSSDEFVEINKSVSRSLYSKITGDGRLREWEKARWQSLAKKEVDRQVELLKDSKS